MLAYVVVLGTVLNLFASIFVSNTRLGALNTTALDRLRGIEELQHVFRDTVRQSSAIVPRIAEYKTAEDQLVLKAQSEVRERYIILGILPNDGRMYRLDLVEQDGELTPAYKATYPQKLAELRFDPDPETDLIAMEAVLHKKEGEHVGRRVVHRFAASPRTIE
jgi:hypothetical protein